MAIAVASRKRTGKVGIFSSSNALDNASGYCTTVHVHRSRISRWNPGGQRRDAGICKPEVQPCLYCLSHPVKRRCCSSCARSSQIEGTLLLFARPQTLWDTPAPMVCFATCRHWNARATFAVIPSGRGQWSYSRRRMRGRGLMAAHDIQTRTALRQQCSRDLSL